MQITKRLTRDRIVFLYVYQHYLGDKHERFKRMLLVPVSVSYPFLI